MEGKCAMVGTRPRGAAGRRETGIVLRLFTTARRPLPDRFSTAAKLRFAHRFNEAARHSTAAAAQEQGPFVR
jgi:hypothetical protein